MKIPPEHRKLLTDDPLEALALTDRVADCLRIYGVVTIRDLARLSESDLLGILNVNGITNLPFGPPAEKAEIDDRLTAIGEVRRKLRDHDLSLYSGTHAENSSSGIEVSTGTLVTQRLSLPISVVPLSVRAENCLRGERIFRLVDLVQRSETDLLHIPNLGKTTVEEIKTHLRELGLSLGMAIRNLPCHEQLEESDTSNSMFAQPLRSDLFHDLETIEDQLYAIVTRFVKPAAQVVAWRRLGWGGREFLRCKSSEMIPLYQVLIGQ